MNADTSLPRLPKTPLYLSRDEFIRYCMSDAEPAIGDDKLVLVKSKEPIILENSLRFPPHFRLDGSLRCKNTKEKTFRGVIDGDAHFTGSAPREFDQLTQIHGNLTVEYADLIAFRGKASTAKFSHCPDFINAKGDFGHCVIEDCPVISLPRSVDDGLDLREITMMDAYHANRNHKGKVNISGCQNLTTLFGTFLCDVAIADCEKLDHLPEDSVFLRSLAVENCPIEEASPVVAGNMDFVNVPIKRLGKNTFIGGCLQLSEVPETVFCDGVINDEVQLFDDTGFRFGVNARPVPVKRMGVEPRRVSREETGCPARYNEADHPYDWILGIPGFAPRIETPTPAAEPEM